MQIPELKTVLYANGIFCSLSALLILLIPGVLTEYVINLPAIVFIMLGIGLLLFALDVLMTARKPAPGRGKLLYIFIADTSWVVLTPVIMVLLASRITNLGNMLLLDIAIIVAAFAVLEWIGIGKLKASSEQD